MLIEQPPCWFRRFYPSALWRMNDEERAVYLTFDDGPIPRVTTWVLDLLDKYGIKATFFLVGDNIRKHQAEYEDIIRRGHVIGNHTYHHLQGVRTTLKGYIRDIERFETLHSTKLFRPPHGFIRAIQWHYLKKHYRIVMWDVVTRDYSKRTTAEDVLENVKRYARNGSIITFHDSLKAEAKLREALPKAIEWLKDEGYAFCTL